MAPRGAGDLRERIAFWQRSTTSDGMGNEQGAWVQAFQRAAQVLPMTRGASEEVVAARLQGKALYDIWVYFDRQTSALTPDWRITDTRAQRSWNIRFVGDMDGRRQWLLIQAEWGIADG